MIAAGQEERGRDVAVELRDVSVRFGETTALEQLSLTVRRGECLALLGPSGSGKSTALNALAGFVRPTSGRVHLDGRDATDLPPARRGLGFVVQSYALFPHMSVRDNIAFGLTVRGVRGRDAKARVDEVAELVGMAAHLDRRPGQLSGGQQQRVAMARALAIKPSVLLLDEPTSALDSRLREAMLDELRRLRRELPDVAMVVVTHDQNEAMALADSIALLRDGRCEAWDTVENLFYRPPTAYSATFLGSAGILPGRLEGPVPGGARAVVLGRETVVQPTDVAPGTVDVAVRPWQWALERGAAGPDWLTGTVEGDQWRGAVHRYHVRIDGLPDTVPVELPDGPDRPQIGDTVRLRPLDGAAVVVPTRAPAGATR